MSLKRKFAHFALPSIVSMWVFALYTMVDGFFVSWGCGEAALAAVNIASPFSVFIFAVGLVFATGCSTVISILLGQGNREEANRIFTQNVVLLAAASLIIPVAVFFFSEPLARFLGASDSNLFQVREYLMGISAFASFFTVSYNMEVLVKTDGSPQVSAIGVICCALTNVVLDYVFVIRFGWGVLGAAIATGIAQVASTTLFLLYFFFRSKKLHFVRFRPNLSIYRRVIPIGLADGITELSGGIVIFLFNHTILRVIGEAGVVSYTIISYVNTLTLNAMAGTTQGMQPLVSFHYGKGDIASCHKLLRYALTTAGAMALVIFAGVQLGAELIVSIFIRPESAQVFAYTAHALRIFSFSFLLVGANVVLSGFFAAMELPRSSFSISLSRGLVLLVLSLSVLAALLGDSGIWAATGVSEALCLVLSLSLFFRYLRRRKSAAAEPVVQGEPTYQDQSVTIA